MEFGLDTSIAAIFRLHNGLEINSQFPVTLEKKLEFLKQAIAANPFVREAMLFARPSIIAIGEAKEFRNTVIHGLPMKIESDGTAYIVRTRHEVSGATYAVRQVGRKDWRDYEEITHEAGARFMVAALLLSPDITSQPLFDGEEKPSRESVMEFTGALPVSKRLRNLVAEIWLRIAK